nr:hypothetical protein BaRGS_034906 [Batillaria attramentaria]
MVSSVDSGQSSALDPDRLADSYNTGLRKVLDRHAPSVTRRVRDRPSSPWLSDDVRDARRKRRAAERRWRKSGLTIHRQMFVHQRSAVVAVIEQAKRQYYDDKINSTSSSKQLFAAFSELQGKSRNTPLPTSIPRRDLPQKFCNFFHDKIKQIRSDLDSTPCDPPSYSVYNGPSLSSFRPVTEK